MFQSFKRSLSFWCFRSFEIKKKKINKQAQNVLNMVMKHGSIKSKAVEVTLLTHCKTPTSTSLSLLLSSSHSLSSAVDWSCAIVKLTDRNLLQKSRSSSHFSAFCASIQNSVWTERFSIFGFYAAALTLAIKMIVRWENKAPFRVYLSLTNEAKIL